MYNTISYFHSPCYLQSYFIYIIPFDIYNLIISHCYYHPICSPFQRRAHLKLVKVLWQKRENFSHTKLLLSMTTNLVFYYSKIGLALGKEKLSEYSFHSD